LPGRGGGKPSDGAYQMTVLYHIPGQQSGPGNRDLN
jgi:hypothetical protein